MGWLPISMPQAFGAGGSNRPRSDHLGMDHRGMDQRGPRILGRLPNSRPWLQKIRRGTPTQPIAPSTGTIQR